MVQGRPITTTTQQTTTPRAAWPTATWRSDLERFTAYLCNSDIDWRRQPFHEQEDKHLLSSQDHLVLYTMFALYRLRRATTAFDTEPHLHWYVLVLLLKFMNDAAMPDLYRCIREVFGLDEAFAQRALAMEWRILRLMEFDLVGTPPTTGTSGTAEVRSVGTS